jgi:UDP-N-acetyl-D-glucosamine dehydrogenase
MDIQDLAPAIAGRTARIAVLGQGYVGLPLSMEFAHAGFKVLGLEVDPSKVEALNAGESYIPDIPSEMLRGALEKGYEATTDATRLAEADAILITVPTPYTKTKQPDMTYVREATRMVAATLRPGQLIILESTTYPGTTEELLQPELEAKGLKVGVEFELAYSPERIDPGNPRFGLRTTPKVVGGLTPRATELSKALYDTIVERTVVVSTARAAEMTKLLENTYRHVNIALANEMALLCHRMNINVWEVVEAAASKPFGFSAFYPGPGVGGHCIPIDPYYLVWKAQENEVVARLVETAGEINEGMPDWVISRIADLLNDRGRSLRDSRVLLVGITYKKDLPDMRESPAVRVLEKLVRKGARVSYHDPYVPELPIHYGFMASQELTAETLSSADCVVILTDHSNLDRDLIVAHAPAVLDTRNVLKGYDAPSVDRL